MSSIRLRGVSVKVSDETIFEKAKKIRAEIGDEYRIVIEKDRITVEGDILDPEIRRRISEILVS